MVDQAGAAEALRSLVLSEVELGKLNLEDALKRVKEEASKVKKSFKDGRRAEALFQLAQAEVHILRGEYHQALRLGQDAFAFFDQEEDVAYAVEATTKAVVPAHLARNDGPRALVQANQALVLAQRLQKPLAEAQAWQAVAGGRYASGSSDGSEAANRALSLFRELGDTAQEATTLNIMASGALKAKKHTEAVATAKDAIAMAKAANDWNQVGLGIETLVEAHIQAGSPGAGLKAAQEEVKELEAEGAAAQKALPYAMEAEVVAHAAIYGADSAVSVVKTSVEKLRAAGNKKGEVKMLHKLACISQHKDVAMNTAQAALTLAQQSAEVKEERAIKKTLTDLYVAKGKMEKAPNRREALGLLAELARELERRDGDRFGEVNKTLDGFWNALAQTDIEASMQKVIAKNPTVYLEFLKAHGANVAAAPANAHQIRPVPVPHLYYGFRVSGLGYGPKFRCCSPAYKQMNEPGVVGVLELQECHEDWERDLGYSPSLLDCALQAGAAMGHQV